MFCPIVLGFCVKFQYSATKISWVALCVCTTEHKTVMALLRNRINANYHETFSSFTAQESIIFNIQRTACLYYLSCGYKSLDLSYNILYMFFPTDFDTSQLKLLSSLAFWSSNTKKRIDLSFSMADLPMSWTLTGH